MITKHRRYEISVRGKIGTDEDTYQHIYRCAAKPESIAEVKKIVGDDFRTVQNFEVTEVLATVERKYVRLER